MVKKIADLRKDYTRGELSELLANSNPYLQFEHWWAELLQTDFLEPNAMVLATATPQGKPSARVVLLKNILPDEGFVFFTNFNSRKGQEIAANSAAALLFYWDIMERQVRIEGNIIKAPDSLSDQYYHSRPEGSRVGAWASPQSEVIASREELQQRIEHLQAQWQSEVPSERPPFWGGYILVPTVFEFWQGRASRLHDRLQYVQQPDKSWQIQRLAP